MLGGMLELAEQILDLPVRQGLPREIQGLTDELSHPVYATAIGLAILGAQAGTDNMRIARKPASPWLLNKFLSWISSS